MRPYLFLPFVREALEKRFEDDPFVAVYATSSYLVAKAGGHRLKIVVKTAPEGKFQAIYSSISSAGGTEFSLSTLSV